MNGIIGTRYIASLPLNRESITKVETTVTRKKVSLSLRNSSRPFRKEATMLPIRRNIYGATIYQTATK